MKQQSLDLLLDRNSDFYNPVTEALLRSVPVIKIPDPLEYHEINTWINMLEEVDDGDSPHWCGLRDCPSNNFLKDRCDCLRSSFASYASKQEYTQKLKKDLVTQIKSELRFI